MALSTYVDTFTVPTSAVGTTIVRTGYGFAPKAIFVWNSGRGESVDAVGGQDYSCSLGVATSATARYLVVAQSRDTGGTTDSDKSSATDCILRTLTTGAAALGSLDVQSFDADGVTFIIDAVFSAARRVSVWAIGGSDITNAAVQAFNSPTAAGSQTITVPGSFQPSVIFLLGHRLHGNNGLVSLGYACAAAQQGVLALRARDNVTTTDTLRYATDTHCIAVPNTSSPNLLFDAELTTMTSTGFTLNWVATEATARVFGVLAIAGGTWTGFSSATRTDSTPWSVTGLGVAPAGLFVASVGTTEQTRNALAAHTVWSVGAAASPTNRAAHGLSDVNNLVGAQTATILEHDAVYARLDLADGIAGLMDVQSFDSNGVTFVMDDPDPDAAFFWGVACGSTAAAGETRTLTATCTAATTTPASVAQQARALTALCTAATTTPPSGAQQLRAFLGNLPSATTTAASLLRTSRAMVGLLAGATTTPPIAIEAPPSVPTTWYLQDRTLATLWRVEMRDGTLYWEADTATAQAEPVLLDQDNFTTIYTLYINNGTLRWEVAGTGPAPFYLRDTVSDVIWDIYIASNVLYWDSVALDPFGAIVMASTQTPSSLSTMRRALQTAAVAVSSTPPAAIQMAGQIQWAAQVAGQTSTPASLVTQRRALTAASSAQTQTPSSLSTQRRALTAAGVAQTTTPAAGASMAGQIAFAAASIGQTTTPPSLVTQRRALTALCPSQTTTPAAVVQMAGVKSFAAAASAQTTTPPSLVTQRRALTATSPGQTSTPPSVVQMAGLRQLVAQVTAHTETLPLSLLFLRRVLGAQAPGVTQTPTAFSSVRRPLQALPAGVTNTFAAVVQRQRALTALLAGITTTFDSTVRMSRRLTALLSGVSQTPPVALPTGQRRLTATVSGLTNTFAALVHRQRALTAVLPAQTSTGDIVVQMAGLIQLSANARGQTQTPTAISSTRRPLLATLPASTTTPAVLGAHRRPMLATLPGHTTVPTSVSLLQRALRAVLSAVTTTSTSILRRERALTALLVGVTQTSVTTFRQRRPLTATLSAVTQTSPVSLTPRRAFTAVASGVTRTPAALYTQHHELTALAPAQTSTASVVLFLAEQRSFVAHCAAATTTSPATVSFRHALRAQCTTATLTATPTLMPGDYGEAIRPPPALASTGFTRVVRPTTTVGLGTPTALDTAA